MKKYLLLTGLLAVLTLNSAHANDYYNQNNSYYQQQPRFRRLTNEEVRKYEERRIYKEETDTKRIRPYVGFDIAATKLKPKDSEDKKIIDDDLTAFKGVIGARINQNWGIEAFYQMTGDEKKSKNVGDGLKFESTVNYKAYGLDIIRYIPLNQDVELMAALGLGQYDFEAKGQLLNANNPYYPPIWRIDEEEKKKFDSLGVRLGIGVQYNIDENIALLGMFRYVHMTDDDYVKNLMEASLGVRYTF